MNQLKTKDHCRIATFPPGTSAYGYAALYKEKFDLECDLVPLQNPAAQVGALSAGRADAIVGAYSNWAQSLADNKVTLIGDTRSPAERKQLLGKEFPEVVLFGLTDTLKQNRPAVAAFLKGIDQAYDFVQDNSVETVSSLLKQFGPFASLSDGARQSTVASTIPYLRLGSNRGFIEESRWAFALQRYSLWDLPGLNPSAPANTYDRRIDMSYYRQGIGQPEGS